MLKSVMTIIRHNALVSIGQYGIVCYRLRVIINGSWALVVVPPDVPNKVVNWGLAVIFAPPRPEE